MNNKLINFKTLVKVTGEPRMLVTPLADCVMATLLQSETPDNLILHVVAEPDNTPPTPAWVLNDTVTSVMTTIVISIVISTLTITANLLLLAPIVVNRVVLLKTSAVST